MAVLRPTLVGTSMFTFVKEENMLVAEASDLPPFGRVYDDACDEGYTVVSSDTGREVVYAVSGIHRPDDLLWWDLTPADMRDRNIDRTGGKSLPTIRIYND